MQLLMSLLWMIPHSVFNSIVLQLSGHGQPILELCHLSLLYSLFKIFDCRKYLWHSSVA